MSQKWPNACARMLCMTTAVAPSLALSPRVPLTARQRACLEQLARRPTRPQRLERRATILLARAPGAPQGHVMRQLHLQRGTGPVWGRRWGALTAKLAPMAAAGSRDKSLTTVIVAAFTAHPRAGTPATCTAAPMGQMVAGAWADPAAAGRPV